MTQLPDYPLTQSVAVVLYLHDGLRDDLLLGERGLLVLAGGDPRRRSRQQLTRPRAGGDNEFEGVRQLASIDHGSLQSIHSLQFTIYKENARAIHRIFRND